MKAQENWMSTVDSATYKFTLYLAGVEVWNDPSVLSGDDSNILNRGQASIIAESGVTGSYAVENVMMISTLTPGASTGNTVTGTIQFDLIEPLGFSLLERILAYGSQYNFSTLREARYILKLELLGRDSRSGKPAKYPGVFFYRLIIDQMRARVGAGGTTYNIVAGNAMRTALRSTPVEKNVTVTGVKTVNDLVTKLESALNEYEISKKKTKENPEPVTGRYWKIEFDPSTNISAGSEQSSLMMKSKINLPSESLANVSTSDAAGVAVDTTEVNSVDISFSPGTNVVSQLTNILQTDVTGFTNFVNQNVSAGGDTPYIHVVPSIKLREQIDSDTGQNVVDITLTIRIDWAGSTYLNPNQYEESVKFQEQRLLEKSINKRYSYLYSGENLELLDFNLEFDNLFVNAIDISGAENYYDNTQILGATTLKPALPAGGNRNTYGTNVYLGDVKIDNLSIGVERPVFEYQRMASDKQQQIDSAPDTNKQLAIRAREYATRSNDFLEATFEIKGDPYWLGTPDAVVMGQELTPSGLYQEALITFVNYLPDESMTEPGPNRTKRFDMISSGIYKVLTLESKFMNGSFTQTLNSIRDSSFQTYRIANKIIGLGYDNT